MKKIPVKHPGELLKSEFIEPNDLSVYRVAKDAGIPQPTLQLIVTGKRPISAEVALRLGIYFKIDAQFWMNLQSEYDLRMTKTAKFEQIEKEVHPLAKAA